MAFPEKNRRQRKARLISVRNAFRRWPDCVYGDVYCNHVYEPETPWQWVDFRFLGKRYPRRYFAVAATTLLYEAFSIADEKACKLADVEVHLPVNDTLNFDNLDGDEALRHWVECRNRHLKELVQESYTLRPRIEVRLDYGSVAVGVLPRLNIPNLNPSLLQDFANEFRWMGEPLQHGIVWEGREVEVVPAEIYKGL
jgi:hypothetical protein